MYARYVLSNIDGFPIRTLVEYWLKYAQNTLPYNNKFMWTHVVAGYFEMSLHTLQCNVLLSHSAIRLHTDSTDGHEQT